MTINHPTFKTLVLEATFHPAEKETPQSNYSLGDPSFPASWEVTGVSYKDQDVTDFIFNFCDHLFSEFGEDLLGQFPHGVENWFDAAKQ